MTTTEHAKATRLWVKPRQKPSVREKKQEQRPRTTAGKPTLAPVGNLRAGLGLTQIDFARLLAISVRSLATMEAGADPSEPVARRITEIERLTAALAEVIQQAALGKWLQTPNPAFGGSKPLEVVERGEGDRLWEMIYFLRSGVPS